MRVKPDEAGALRASLKMCRDTRGGADGDGMISPENEWEKVFGERFLDGFRETFATRSADGPISTPRRLAPRSIGTPMMRTFSGMC
jgi:hypothetical protein